MATTITANISATSRATIRNAQSLGASFNAQPSIQYSRSFTSVETTKAYFATLSVTSTPTVLDLTALTDAFGAALVFATVRHLAVWHKGTSGTVTVGGGSNPVVAVLPGLVGSTATNGQSNGADISITTTITVDGTHKNLALVASAGTLAVDLLLLGA